MCVLHFNKLHTNDGNRAAIRDNVIKLPSQIKYLSFKYSISSDSKLCAYLAKYVWSNFCKEKSRSRNPSFRTVDS